jgi:hypothetical protein
MPQNEWNVIEAEIAHIIESSNEPFSAKTILNTRDLLAICRLQCALPTSVSKGYWSTISLSWRDFEFEVFEDRVEVYHFFDGTTDIWYEEHNPGESFSPRLLAELPKLAT